MKFWRGMLVKLVKFLILFSLSLPAIAWDCPNWIEEEQSVTQVTDNISAVKVGIYCSQYEGEKVVTQLDESKWATYHVRLYRTFGPFKYHLGTFGETTGVVWDNDDVLVMDIPDGDSDTFAVANISSSASNIGIELKAISADMISVNATDSITSPITQYQATNRQGSVSEIVGFYVGKKGEILIDTLVPDKGNAERCNACAQYHVATLKFKSGKFSEVSRFLYDITAYSE